MTPLASLEEFKVAKGEPTAASPANDPLYTAALDAASQLALTYTDRDFGVDADLAADRTFDYDGSGVLNIDDCTAVHSVTIGTGAALAAAGWRAMPRRAPETGGVYAWIELGTTNIRSGSRAMGFTYNLDTYDGPIAGTYEITVNADWGWPEVPADVKQAVIWIAGVMTDTESVDSGGRELTSENIAEVARSWATDSESTSLAIPKPAQMILDLYKRWSL